MEIGARIAPAHAQSSLCNVAPQSATDGNIIEQFCTNLYKSLVIERAGAMTAAAHPMRVGDASKTVTVHLSPNVVDKAFKAWAHSSHAR